MCGSAFKNKGVQPLLDAVVDYLPSPLDIPPVKGIKPDSDDEVVRAGRRQGAVRRPRLQDHGRSRSSARSPSCASIRARSRSRHRRAQFGQGQDRARRPHAADACQQREDVKEAYAGDIVAFAGLKLTTTGETLCDPEQPGDPGAHGIPRSGHRSRDRAEDQGRPGKDGHGAGASGARKIRPSASRPIRKPARPSSRAWANSISRSRSTS